MQELVGRLTSLDPEASETLKVVSYFDALIAAGAGLEPLLRGAAVLTGAVAGAELGAARTRIGPDGGRRPEPDAGGPWPTREIAAGAVWIERSGPAHANDDMVLERLALAVSLLEVRRAPGGSAVDVVIDAARPASERAPALARLRLDASARVRAIVAPGRGERANGHESVAVTPHGVVRVVIDAGDCAVPPRAGVGVWGRADDLPESFATAALALRLTDEATPVVDAAELGVLLTAVRELEPAAAGLPDVRAVAGLDVRSLAVADALAAAGSVRAAAASLRMHHSTVQSRHEALTRELGFDPRSAAGRARYHLARLLVRLVR